MHRETVLREFTEQAESFGTSDSANAPEALEALLRVAAAEGDERWLDAACGPGVVSRALAPSALSVHGVDATPAMIDVARRDAAAGGFRNVTFGVGDVTALDLADASFDAAVSRFAIHHIPVPGRIVEELARVVRPGGKIVLGDHVAHADGDLRAWAEEIERLRDPSHWGCLPVGRLRDLAAGARLSLEAEEVVPLRVDFEGWLRRGSGGAVARPLIERALAERPHGGECFRVSAERGRRVLELCVWLSRWRRPVERARGCAPTG